MVVLPTFFYSTAFSQVVNAWAVISMADLTKLSRGSGSLVSRVTMIVNVILYAFLIAVVSP
jgi:hypothetical protein